MLYFEVKFIIRVLMALGWDVGTRLIASTPRSHSAEVDAIDRVTTSISNILKQDGEIALQLHPDCAIIMERP